MPLSDVEQGICESIAARGQRLRQDLAEHVAIATGQGNLAGLQRYRALLAERLGRLGASISLVPGERRPAWLEVPGAAARSGDSERPVLLAERRGSDAGRRVLLVGHLDTVHDPHGAFDRLTVAPDGRTATGPGAADMKGGLLVALTALEALAEAGVSLDWTVLLNSDEETGSFHSDASLRAAARRHDIGLVFEPALPDGALAIERMGSGQFRIDVLGRSAHVGRAFEQGVSAVTKLGELLLALDALAEPQRGVVVNVGPLRGGAVTNAVPDQATCWGNVRFADPQAGRRLGEQIDALATPDDAMPRVVVQRAWNRPAKPQTEAVRRAAEAACAAAADLGQRLPLAATGGVCDGNILQDEGLATLDTLGVRGGNLHRTDEFVELKSLEERSQLTAVLLARLAAGRIELPGRG